MDDEDPVKDAARLKPSVKRVKRPRKPITWRFGVKPLVPGVVSRGVTGHRRSRERWLSGGGARRSTSGRWLGVRPVQERKQPLMDSVTSHRRGNGLGMLNRKGTRNVTTRSNGECCPRADYSPPLRGTGRAAWEHM